jgi:predicted transcriptional regulator
MLEKTSPLELTIKIPFELQEQTQHLAMQRGETIPEIIYIALAHYINSYQKPVQPVKPALSLEEGRNLMRELGLGLGHSSSPHDVARNHDLYLYEK